MFLTSMAHPASCHLTQHIVLKYCSATDLRKDDQLSLPRGHVLCLPCQWPSQSVVIEENKSLTQSVQHVHPLFQAGSCLVGQDAQHHWDTPEKHSVDFWMGFKESCRQEAQLCSSNAMGQVVSWLTWWPQHGNCGNPSRTLRSTALIQMRFKLNRLWRVITLEHELANVCLVPWLGGWIAKPWLLNRAPLYIVYF